MTKHTFRVLTNEEARKEYGSCLVFVGNSHAFLLKPKAAAAKETDTKEKKADAGGVSASPEKDGNP